MAKVKKAKPKASRIRRPEMMIVMRGGPGDDITIDPILHFCDETLLLTFSVLDNVFLRQIGENIAKLLSMTGAEKKALTRAEHEYRREKISERRAFLMEHGSKLR